MKIKLPYGSTAQNNQLTLPAGMLSVDIDKKALRLHDGATQGGFEMVGTQAYIPPYTGPGRQTLLFGNDTKGYYGTVTEVEFITGAGLASLTGLSGGNSIVSDGWLKFSLDNKTLFIAKKPFRSHVNWNMLNGLNLVAGKAVTIAGHNYIVRLPKAATVDPALGLASGVINGVGSAGSEWNRLMYHISNGSGETLSPEGITVGDWAQFSASDLNLSNVMMTLCKELTDASNAVYHITVSSTGDYPKAGYAFVDPNAGWRPVLEFVS